MMAGRALQWRVVFCMLMACAVRAGIVVSVDRVPSNGVVLARVDLTAAARLEGLVPLDPSCVVAVDAGSGREVPFQLVPGDGYDAVSNVAGYLVARLPPGGPHRLRIEQRSSGDPFVGATNWRGTITNGACVIGHDATRLGGFPSSIAFTETGKRFDDFRWQDRVYDPDSGCFHLRYDPSPEVTLVARGPLCTAVRVCARYMAAGNKAPSSNPRAMYEWLYFADLPLAFVHSVSVQDHPFEWSECHFLELNFPGKDFPRWAGEDPPHEGEFEGKAEIAKLGRWGALLDGRNAIGMFGCGNVTQYDGRGGYGTYLHARASQSWQAWSEGTREYAGWLWVGVDDRPAERIAAWSAGPPSGAEVTITTDRVRETVDAAVRRAGDDGWRGRVACALVQCGRLEEAVGVCAGRWPADWRYLRAGELVLILSAEGDGVSIVALIDAARGESLLASPAMPLFSVRMCAGTGDGGRARTLEADRGWRTAVVDVDGGGTANAPGTLKIRWGKPVDADLEGVGVVVTVRADAGAHALCWRLRVENANRRWGVERVAFPRLDVRFPGRDLVSFVPQGAGVARADMVSTAARIGGTYPNGWMTMQYLAAYAADGSGGLYVGFHDPAGATKELCAEGRPASHTMRFAFEVPVPGMGCAGSGYEMPGEAVWRLFRGDWYDAATIYRAWVVAHADWWPRLGAEGRMDTPAWMRELPAWAQMGGAPGQCVGPVAKMADSLGVPIGFHWYNWHRIPFDNDYPHYFPTRDGVVEGVAELRTHGVYPMPYINGRLWDTRDRGTNDWQFTSVARPAATKDEKGEPYTETYRSTESDGSTVRLAVMCPATELWQRRVGDIVARLYGDVGVSGVYIDQVGAASPRLCRDASHGHPVGGGHWWVDGYGRMLEAIRAAKAADRILTTECNAEPYMRWFDGYLTWHWQQQDMVPAFSAVYGGAIQLFGRAYGGGPTREAAACMKAGQQLVFGEQIGWFNPAVLDWPVAGPFVRDAIHLRWRLRRYFSAGHMLRPPRVTGDVPRVTADWQWHGEWPVTTPAIMTGAWTIPAEKRVVLLLTNVGDRELAVGVRWPDEARALGKTARLTTVMPGGDLTAVSVDTTVARTVTLPARGVLAWELTADD